MPKRYPYRLAEPICEGIPTGIVVENKKEQRHTQMYRSQQAIKIQGCTEVLWVEEKTIWSWIFTKQQDIRLSLSHKYSLIYYWKHLSHYRRRNRFCLYIIVLWLEDVTMFPCLKEMEKNHRHSKTVRKKTADNT